MKAMILAAGYGTRFRPATFELPKPLIPLCNHPLIGYAVDALLLAGVDEIIVNLHHLPERLQAWLEERYRGRCRFHFSFEKVILGTGGGIRKVRDLLADEEDFFVVNGDTVQDPPLDDLRAARRASDALAALALRKPPANDRFTQVFFDGTSVTGFGEGRGEPLMFSGCHVISRRIFDVLPQTDYSGITEDVYLRVAGSSDNPLTAVVDQGRWFDIGTPRRYIDAAAQLRELMVAGNFRLPPSTVVRGDSLVGEGAEVWGSLSRSVIGSGCLVAKGATVVDAALWDRAKAGEGAVVADSILGEDVVLPAGATVENALVCRFRDEVEYPSSMTVAGGFVATPIDASKPLRIELP
jgi:NDP-sugar pyrophosphorylase family protein